MKLQVDNLPPSITSGGLAPMDMGISDNAEDQLMILNVLSNTLYTDKVSACLREYGCNAADANVEAGKGDIPIEVTLPNKLEPTLRIRDFGFGMNEAQIANTFCKLGRSTKRSSNAFTGMLGIGSKSGFAYGDSFMITSWADGRKIVYNAFRDQGVPRLAKMLDMPSDAPDGIEVKIPVRIVDIPEFLTKAERVYRYFKVRPIIHGAKIVFGDAVAKFGGTGWRYTGSGSSFAVMGNVGYDLTTAGMGLSPYGGTSNSDMINIGVELDFEIGELEIAANREGLQYRDQTKNAILARLKIVKDEIGNIFTKQIGGAATLWEAHEMYAGVFEKTGARDMRSLRDMVKGKIEWQGVKINTGLFKIQNTECDPEVHVWAAAKLSFSHHLQKATNPFHCYVNKHVVLVINDLPTKKNSPRRVKGWYENHPDTQQFIVFTFATPAAQARYWKARGLEGAPTINFSSVPQSLAVQQKSTGPSAHRDKHAAECFVLDETCSIDRYDNAPCSRWWMTDTADIKRGAGVFVPIEGFEVKVEKGFDEHPRNFIGTVKALRAAGLVDDGPIYGFKPAKIERLGPKWVTLRNHVQANLDQTMAKPKAPQELADAIALAGHKELFKEQHLKVMRLPSGTPLHKLLSEMERMRHPKTFSSKLLNVSKGPWLKLPALPTPSVDLVNLEQMVRTKYPVIQLLEISQSRSFTQSMTDTQMKTLADYIRLVESA